MNKIIVHGLVVALFMVITTPVDAKDYKKRFTNNHEKSRLHEGHDYRSIYSYGKWNKGHSPFIIHYFKPRKLYSKTQIYKRKLVSYKHPKYWRNGKGDYNKGKYYNLGKRHSHDYR